MISKILIWDYTFCNHAALNLILWYEGKIKWNIISDNSWIFICFVFLTLPYNCYFNQNVHNSLDLQKSFCRVMSLGYFIFEQTNNSPEKTFACTHIWNSFADRVTFPDLYTLSSMGRKRQISPRSLWHFKWLCKLFCVFFMINVKHTSIFTPLSTNKLFCRSKSFQLWNSNNCDFFVQK